ncbi:hypothetical protein BU15DRAFT_67701 [Melanogaster broomeanus]|nr:hypothetical protein BU15DRAFT_67701 [Melanogaster broomeanus]
MYGSPNPPRISRRSTFDSERDVEAIESTRVAFDQGENNSQLMAHRPSAKLNSKLLEQAGFPKLLDLNVSNAEKQNTRSVTCSLPFPPRPRGSMLNTSHAGFQLVNDRPSTCSPPEIP